jgi:hypothetical protein
MTVTWAFTDMPNADSEPVVAALVLLVAERR